MPMSVEEQVRLLSMVNILGPLSEEEMEEFAQRVPDTYLEQGDILYTPHESSERLFILKKGRVQVYEIDQTGDEITLSVVEGGNIFGEMSLTGQSLQGVYVRALAPSFVVSLKRTDLEDLILKKPEVGLRLMRELAERLRASQVRYANIIHKNVPARLATLILTLVDSEGLETDESYRITTRYTHEQLASMIGSKRVAVTRAFRKLEEARAVRLKDRYIIVKDLDALREAAAS
jgi:CRP/FNR family transcriptional regulator, cyclic AMP receptor protein